MAGGENDFLAVRVEVRTGGAALSGADADGFAGGQVLREDLVERVAAILLLGLEDDRPAVRRKVALPGPDKIERDLPYVRGGFGLLRRPVGGGLRRGEGQGEKQRGHCGRLRAGGSVSVSPAAC